jgi:hypothetical protein
MRSTRNVILALTLSLAGSTVASAQRLPSDSLEVARRYARWSLAGQVDSIVPRVPAGALEALGGRDGIQRAGATVAERAGAELRVIEERFVWRNGKRQYWRTMAMSQMDQHFLLRIVIEHDGRFGGYGLGTPDAAPPTDSGGPPIRP